MVQNNIQKAKAFLKESIIKKRLFVVNDTNIYIDYLKYLERPYSEKTSDHLNNYDVFQLINFCVDYSVLLFDLNTINNEIDKKMPILISQEILSGKSIYELDGLKKKLNYSELYVSTKEEIQFSETYGKMYIADIFGRKLKDNRNDLLIYLVAKKNKLKLIITNNYTDFIACEQVYIEHINSKDVDELLILTPQQMIIIINELKRELGEKVVK